MQVERILLRNKTDSRFSKNFTFQYIEHLKKEIEEPGPKYILALSKNNHVVGCPNIGQRLVKAVSD